MENHYLKLQNHDIYAQRMIPRPSSFNIKCKKLINYYPKSSKFSNSAMSGFYSTKNFFSNRINNFTSSHNYNLFSSKPQTPKMRKIQRIKPQSASYKRSFPEVVNHLNRSMNSNSCLETEKLFQETYQIKKLIRQLQKQLDKITKENHKKDRQLNAKENLINDIIIQNNLQYNEEDTKNNNFNYSINNMKYNRPDSAVNILCFKIKREIRNTINEIYQENHKLEKLKKSVYLTKTKELNIESNLYNEQINKINVLLENALQIKEQNDNKANEFESLNQNIERQDIIIDNLIRENITLESQQEFLNNKLGKLQNDLKIKQEKAKMNDNELNILSIKNKNLSNDKIIQKQIDTNKENGMPITLKSLYTGKVSSLKKSINFYKKQIKYSDDVLNKLKEQKKKLIDSNKNLDQRIKIDSNFIENTSKIKLYQRPQTAKGEIKLEQNYIEKMRKEYKEAREEELRLEKKANLYYEKLKEINLEYEEKENLKKEEEEGKNQNQLEFGIDETNPYYTDNEENIPESNIKFTSQQFNQFTYILFKNFEAKYIIGQEANNKVINPCSDISKKNNYNRLTYPSTEFDEVVENFTRIIMKVLNSENEYNHLLTKIFIGALLYNSECDINKLIEYFSILFSYTKDYSSDEKKYIEKLKSKYKKETKKLVECITSHILNDLTSSQYFSLFKMKDLLDNNEINLKDKYIEFLFYFLKKFDDPEAKLEDLKFSLLNEIVPLGDTTVHSKAFVNKEKEKEEEKENIDLDNIDNIDNKEADNNYLNIEENKEIIFDLDINKENNRMNKTEKSEHNREENIFEKNKKKNKKSKENSSVNKAKQESKKGSTPKSNKDININKDLNADLFEDNDNSKSQNNINNDIDNDSSINNKAKIDDNDNEDIKENGDSDFIRDNSKEQEINNISQKEKKDKESIKESNKESNKDNKINGKDELKEEEKEKEKEEEKEKEKDDTINEIDENKNKKEKEKKRPISAKKYREDEINEENKNPTPKISNGNEEEINRLMNSKTEGERNKTNENNEDESVTEITNEDFIRHIKDSLKYIQTALDANSLEFLTYIKENIKKKKINGEEFEYINIEDLNEKLVEIDVILSDLQLSCLCSKYSLPDELRLINVVNFQKSLQDFKDGKFQM